MITENENLHEKQKTNLIKSVFDQLETETETENELEGGKIVRVLSKLSNNIQCACYRFPNLKNQGNVF